MTQQEDPQQPTSLPQRSFEELAGQPPPGSFSEFLHFLSTSRKWWLIPIFVILLLLGLIVVLGSTGAAPFIYTLF